MKKGAIFLNYSRGDVVDLEALKIGNRNRHDQWRGS